MAVMINSEYGYVTPQEAEMDARLDKWIEQQSKGKHSQDEIKRQMETRIAIRWQQGATS